MSEENTNWTNADNFKPGSMGCHEALHMVSFFEDSIERELLKHPAIEQNEAWHAAVQIIVNTLGQLYQAIADKHLSV